MIQEIQQLQQAILAELNDDQYAAIEKDIYQKGQGANTAFSLYAIAMNIVFCVLVFKYEDTDSKVCSIVASSFFMVFHCYNFKSVGYWVSLFCVGPIFIAGYVIGRHEQVNTFVFIFQIFLWQGEYILAQILELNNRLTIVREARNPKKEEKIVLQNNLGKLIIEIKQEVQNAQRRGSQLMQQEPEEQNNLGKDINEINQEPQRRGSQLMQQEQAKPEEQKL